MKYVLAFICSMILPIFSLKQSITKLCVNCKNFLPDKESDIYIYGRCSLFPILRKEEDLEQQAPEYYYCSTSRNSENMCGKKGKYYKKKKLIKKIKKNKDNFNL